MKEIIEKFLKIEQEISSEKGALYLFALFLRENAIDVSDLLVAAPWIHNNKAEILKYVVGKVQKALTPKELVQLSRIVLIEKDNPILKDIQSTVHTKQGFVEITDSNFSGLAIKHAYLITSQRNINDTDEKSSVN